MNELVREENIEMMVFNDGGTDSLAFLGSFTMLFVENTLVLTTLGLNRNSDHLKYRISGVSFVRSDGEIMLNEISKQLLKISMSGGYINGIFFPVERLSEYTENLSDVLQEYSAGTA